jgi:hypothetical protein
MAENRKTATASPAAPLPTVQGRVVWCQGHALVREDARWVGVDDKGRPRSLTDADLHRRGWSLTRMAR